MPIYEFYCEDCNTIFNFFSSSVNTTKRPLCPRCKQKRLKRQMSSFARLTGAKEGGDLDDIPIDEARMEKAMNLLAREADRINEDDPRQAAGLMRKLSDAAGVGLGQAWKKPSGVWRRVKTRNRLRLRWGICLKRRTLS